MPRAETPCVSRLPLPPRRVSTTAAVPDTGGEELTLLSRRGAVVLHQIARSLVYSSELGQVPRMRPRRPEDQVDLLAHGARPEQEHHDERMREAHLGPVDGAIAGALDDGEEVVVGGIGEDALDGRLGCEALSGLGRLGAGVLCLEVITLRLDTADDDMLGCRLDSVLAAEVGQWLARHGQKGLWSSGTRLVCDRARYRLIDVAVCAMRFGRADYVSSKRVSSVVVGDESMDGRKSMITSSGIYTTPT